MHSNKNKTYWGGRENGKGSGMKNRGAKSCKGYYD